MQKVKSVVALLAISAAPVAIWLLGFSASDDIDQAYAAACGDRLGEGSGVCDGIRGPLSTLHWITIAAAFMSFLVAAKAYEIMKNTK
ncbi:MAG: hypothetical protein ABSC72_09285 [Methylovirgula sp.]